MADSITVSEFLTDINPNGLDWGKPREGTCGLYE